MNALYSSAFLQLKSKLARSAFQHLFCQQKTYLGIRVILRRERLDLKMSKRQLLWLQHVLNASQLTVCVGSAPSLIKGSNFTPHPINLYMLVGLFIAVSVTTQQHCCLLTEGAPVSCTFPLS